jgi:YbbR domain-containing protein
MLTLIRDLFTKNWGLKLFSFLFALILWLTLTPEEKIFSEKSLTVPLELHNIPSGMEVVEKPPSTVDVTIRAPQSLLGDVNSANVHAVLDLKRATVNQQDFPLNTSSFSVPVGAEVKEVIPSQVTLRLEQLKEAFLDVEPNITGTLPDGYELVGTEVIPPQVLIRVPESKFTDTYKVRTSQIDISSLTQTTEFTVDLILPSPDLRLASSETTVVVRIQVEEKEPEDNDRVS